MELTPEALREVAFREKLRGYNRADVDGFLEEVACAVDNVQARLRALEAGRSLVAEATTPNETREAILREETVARVLLVAQSTADRSIAEAKDLARMIQAQARTDAVRLVTAAEERLQGGSMKARRAAEAKIDELDQLRRNLGQEIAWLRSWVAQRRDDLAEALWDRPPWYEPADPKLGLIVDFVVNEPTVGLRHRGPGTSAT